MHINNRETVQLNTNILQFTSRSLSEKILYLIFNIQVFIKKYIVLLQQQVYFSVIFIRGGLFLIFKNIPKLYIYIFFKEMLVLGLNYKNCFFFTIFLKSSQSYLQFFFFFFFFFEDLIFHSLHSERPCVFLHLWGESHVLSLSQLKMGLLGQTESSRFAMKPTWTVVKQQHSLWTEVSNNQKTTHTDKVSGEGDF